ncbi:MAG: AMMECR1 domain-containing protein [Eubacteriales bacterium]
MQSQRAVRTRGLTPFVRRNSRASPTAWMCLAPRNASIRWSKLDEKKYGVIVVSGYTTKVLLPNLEGVDTAEEQVKIAKRKAGIPENERCRMERFEVVRHT